MKPLAKTKCIRRCDDVPYKEIEGEVLLLNLKDGSYFGLNHTGKFIWKMLNGKKTRTDIVKALQKKFDISQPTAQKHADGFLGELKKNKLIELSSSRAT